MPLRFSPGLSALPSVLTTLSTVVFASPAAAPPVLPGRCHMSICWDRQFLGKTLIQAGPQGELYAVELTFRTWPIVDAPPATFEPPQTSYVHCSTTRPAFIFDSDGVLYAHLLNPGGDDWAGYNMADYPVYWATCHDLFAENIFSAEVTDQAVELGYSLTLPTDQIQLEQPQDIWQMGEDGAS